MLTFLSTYTIELTVAKKVNNLITFLKKMAKVQRTKNIRVSYFSSSKFDYYISYLNDYNLNCLNQNTM